MLKLAQEKEKIEKWQKAITDKEKQEEAAKPDGLGSFSATEFKIQKEENKRKQ